MLSALKLGFHPSKITTRSNRATGVEYAILPSDADYYQNKPFFFLELNANKLMLVKIIRMLKIISLSKFADLDWEHKFFFVLIDASIQETKLITHIILKHND